MWILGTRVENYFQLNTVVILYLNDILKEKNNIYQREKKWCEFIFGFTDKFYNKSKTNNIRLKTP